MPQTQAQRAFYARYYRLAIRAHEHYNARHFEAKLRGFRDWDTFADAQPVRALAISHRIMVECGYTSTASVQQPA